MTTFRKSLLATAALMAAPLVFGAAITAATGALAQDKIELTVIHGTPTSHVLSAHGVEPWMACVKEGTGDRVDFKYFPGGQLSRTPDLLKSINSGIADLAPIPIGYVSDKMPLNGVSMLPGLGNTAERIIGAYSKAVKTGPLAKEFAANKAVPIWVMAFPPYQMVSMKGTIQSVGDFNGKVIRSAGGSMNLAISSLGASPAEIPVADMYIALERGTADGTISALSSLKPFNVDELMKSVSTNGEFGTFSNVFSIQARKWKTLPEDVQKVMMDCGEGIETSIAKFMDEETKELEEEFAAKGVTVYQFEPDELKAINQRISAANDDWVKRLSGRGLPAEEVLKSYADLMGAQ
jgi:TRAP-type C4-dicarboxylate transport system substrate-binding protein